MPWLPELFSAPALAKIEEERRGALVSVSYFDGLMMGEVDAMVDSFYGEPELHHPVRGRVKGEAAFRAFLEETEEWLAHWNVTIADVTTIEQVAGDRHGFEEVVLHFERREGEGRIDLPHALVADRRPDGLLEELRIYFSTFPISGHHANRPPVLQRDAELRVPAALQGYQRAVEAGDAEAIVAEFEPDGYTREPSGGPNVHRGPEQLRAFYELLFSNGGGIPVEYCATIDDGHCCALEYNLVRWGETDLAPEAGLVVYERGDAGKLAAVRIYDDSDPPPLRRSER